jgi:hypothetical protein
MIPELTPNKINLVVKKKMKIRIIINFCEQNENLLFGKRMQNVMDKMNSAGEGFDTFTWRYR